MDSGACIVAKPNWRLKFLAYATVVLVLVSPISIVATAWLATQNYAEVAQIRAVQAHEQAQLVLLCNRGYILDGLDQAAASLVRQTQPASPIRAAFLQQFASYHDQLVHQLTDTDSPCVK